MILELKPILGADQEIGIGRNIAMTIGTQMASEDILEAWIGTSWRVVLASIGTHITSQLRLLIYLHQSAHHAKRLAASGRRPLEY